MNFLRKTFSIVAKPVIQNYLRKERSYSYRGITLKILPGVFHPGFFFSTKFLLSYLENLDLKNKSLLEPGAGSGLISFIAEKKGAIVTASDLSEQAIKGLEYNKKKIGSEIKIVKSNVLDQISAQKFDVIVINPPYYAKKVTEEWELAWNCGEDFSYFSKFFSSLVEFTHSNVKVIMVLSEDCDIFTIRNIAHQHGWKLEEQIRERFWWEWNFIFECVRV